MTVNTDSGSCRRAGIVYVATKLDRYVEEAFLSADSAKERCPALPITLFTDRLDHPLCATDRFDTVAPAPDVTGISLAWPEGKLRRLLGLRNTPYEYTLHLDADTRVVTYQLMPLFDLLDEFDVAMVETAIDDSACRAQYGRRMFNAGFILYKRNKLVWEWLAEWAAIAERNFRWADKDPLPRVASLRHVPSERVRRNLLTMDQTSLVEILSPEINKFGLKLKILDSSWIYRGSMLSENNREKPRIVHVEREDPMLRQSDLQSALKKIELRKYGQGVAS